MNILDLFWLIVFPAAGIALLYAINRRQQQRLAIIDTYVWPPGLEARLKQHYPHLSPAQIARIGRGLKQFFRAYLYGGRRHVAMPSQAVDALWHAFILHTKAYDAFCRMAFGRFLHHTQAAALSSGQARSNEGLRRVWWNACKEERINPKAPSRLPLLFAIDADLDIPDGYRYVPDCGGVRTLSRERSRTHCGGDFSSTSFDGTTDGLGDGDGGGSGGDGGDGDGGGCGGD